MSVSVPEMVRPRTVSQWGPNAQGVRSRPDRSVDLRSMPVQTMGFAPDVRTVISKVRDTGEYRVRFYVDDIYQGEENDYYTDDREDAEETAEAIEEEAAARARKEAEGEEALGEIAETEEEGGFVEVPLAEESRAVSPVGPQMLPNVPVPNFQGPQVHAMAGGGPPNWQEDLPLGDRPGRRLTPAQIAAGQAGVETGKGILGGTIAAPPDPDAGLPPAGPESEQGTLWDPESQMDRQYMAEMAAQRGAQPEHGYFGAAGSAVSGVVDDLSSMVQGMSAGERAAMISALVAAGLLMTGPGGLLIPIGLGAGLGAMSSAP